jgi:hypothetical protein
MRVAIALLVVLVPAIAAAQPGGTPRAARPPAAASAPTPTPGHEIGGLVELRFGSGGGLELTPDQTPVPRGTIFAGVQLARVALVVGFELGRRTYENDFSGTTTANTVTTYYVLPGIRVTVGRSSDGRTELLGLAELGFGETAFDYDDMFTSDFSQGRFRFELGAGLRHWLGSSFAIGAATTLRHERVRRDDNSGALEEARSTDVVTSLTLSGVF